MGSHGYQSSNSTERPACCQHKILKFRETSDTNDSGNIEWIGPIQPPFMSLIWHANPGRICDRMQFVCQPYL